MGWKICKFLICLLLILSHTQCGIYSLTGASISSDVKTISIPPFYNNAALGPSYMNILFTERLKSYFQQNTSLTVISENGDLNMEGSIENYTLAPIAPSAATGQNTVGFSSQNRITITISVSYTNTKDEAFNFTNKSFSFFQDFDPNTQSLTQNEERYLRDIFDKIILDIFNSTIANW
ncbi:MAG: LptE family protein [Chitinophagaceae bacterium]|nr:LptE family protein [Chitinophagaceae bacterium]